MASTHKLADLGYPIALEETTQLLEQFPVDQRPRPGTCFSATRRPELRQPATSHSPAVATCIVGKTDSKMNRAPLNGGPPRQAASGGGISLKKATVRVARPPTPSHSTSSRMPSESTRSVGNVSSLGVASPARVPVAPAIISGDATTPSVAAPIFGKPSYQDGPATPKAASHTLIESTLGEGSTASKGFGLDLEAQFALLESLSASRVASPSVVPSATAVTAIEQSATKTKDDASNNNMSFPHQSSLQEKRSTTEVKPTVLVNDEKVPSSSVGPVVDKPEAATVADTTGAAPENSSSQDTEVDKTIQEIVDLERDCVKKALEYLISLTGDIGPTCGLLSAVAYKLQRAYASFKYLKPRGHEELRFRYINAIAAFIEETCDSNRDVTKSVISTVLANTNGNFMALCTLLALQGVLSLDNLDQMVALSKAIDRVPLDIAHSAPSPLNHDTLSKDPLEGAMSWPVQEKRDNSPEYRTCILTGLPDQVWGGRLESIKLSKTGPQKAFVKFLEPEACRKYFDATQNGITMPGHKTLILVEKGPGPDSVNDVIRNCADGDATRCVRAYDADEWGTMMLLTFARGKGNTKRETDSVSQGRNSKGRKWVEFRFSSIFEALQFKRVLHEDEDWEHCTINFAPDQCEIAQGVHFQDVFMERESGNPSRESGMRCI